MIIGISGRLGSGKDTVGVIIQYLLCLKLNTLAPHQFKFEDFVRSPASNEIQSGFKIKKFADKLKDIVCILIGCTREQLEDRDFKETPLGEEWEQTYRFDNVLIEPDMFDADWGDYKRPLTPRLMLQLLGTECGREIIHPNIWVNALFADYKTTIPIDNEHFEHASIGHYKFKHNLALPNWIITDMRFPNELEAIKSREGITIRVNRNFHMELPNGIHIETMRQGSLTDIEEHPSEIALDDAKFDYVIENNGTIEELIARVKAVLIKENII